MSEQYTPGDSLPMQLAAIRCCVSGNSGLNAILNALSDDHFGDERVLQLFSACREIDMNGTQVTVDTISAHLAAEKGVADASDVLESVMQAPEADPDFIIRSLTKIRSRQLSHDLGVYLTSQQGAKDGVQEAVAKVNKFLLSHSNMNSEPVQTLTDFMLNIDKPGDKPLIITPGFGEMDQYYRIRPGTLNLVGAPPGTGKTAFLLNIALNVAEQGHDCLFISLEVPEFDLKARAAAIQSGVSAFRMKEKDLMPVEVEHVQAVAAQRMAATNRFHHIAPAKMHVDQLKSEVDRWVASDGIKLILLDYLQVMQAPKSHSKEYEKVSYIGEVLTQTAKATGIPIIAAASTSRSESGKQTMHSLRGSGTLEFNAHTICMLSRDEADKSILIASLVKNRDGGLWEMPLQYDFATQRIHV